MPETNQEIIIWIIVGVFTNLSALVASIVMWIKSAKLIPKEVKKADLDNESTALDNISKGLSLTEQYDLIATRATEKALKTQERFEDIEEKYDVLQENFERLNKEYEKLSLNYSELSKKYEAQEEELASLVKELQIAKAYNTALIAQMKSQNIIPVELSSIEIDDEENISQAKKRSYTKKPKV